jgi:hypothetical protein
MSGPPSVLFPAELLGSLTAGGGVLRIGYGRQGLSDNAYPKEGMKTTTLACGGILLFVPSIAGQTITDPIPEANPARPTVSTPATLAPVGYLQFETGSLGATTSTEFSTRIGINQVTKLTVLPWLEFFVITEPYIHSRFREDKEVHPGEVFVGSQAVIVSGQRSRPAVAVSYIRRLYESPAPELDLGTFRESGTILVSQDVKGFHYDANFIVAEQTESGIRRAQHGQTLSISHPFKKFTISGELWHFTRPFLRSNAVGNLWSISYPLRRNLVIDGGFDHGLTPISTHWEAFIGFTYLLPHRLWSK